MTMTRSDSKGLWLWLDKNDSGTSLEWIAQLRLWQGGWMGRCL